MHPLDLSPGGFLTDCLKAEKEDRKGDGNKERRSGRSKEQGGKRERERQRRITIDNRERQTGTGGEKESDKERGDRYVCTKKGMRGIL